MARPLVLVFQEFAAVTAVPGTPDLNCIIAGPSYHIQDFPDDRTAITLTTEYGTLNGAADDPASEVPDEVVIADPPNNAVGAVLDPASVRIYFDNARAKVANETDAATFDTTLDSQTVTLTGVPGGLHLLGIEAGDYLILTDGASNTLVRKVLTAPVAPGNDLVLSENVKADGGYTPGSGHQWRIERELQDTEIDSSFVTNTPGTNEITIDSGVTVVLSSTLTAQPITYANILYAYRSLRQDLQDVRTVNSVNEVEGVLGRIDARNPLAAGVFVALQNTTTSVQAFGVDADSLVGYTRMNDAIATRNDIYAIVPMTNDTAVFAMYKASVEQLADPNNALDSGVPQKFRVVIGNLTLPTSKTIYEEVATGATEVETGSKTSRVATLTLDGQDLVTDGVLPGHKIIISSDGGPTDRAGTYTVAHVSSATDVELDELVPGADSEAGTATVAITEADGTTPVSTPGAITVTTKENDDLFNILLDKDGAFISAGIIPGDLIEMPDDPAGLTFDSTPQQWTVEEVLSENRIRIANTADNTSLSANELPHGVKRLGSALVPVNDTLRYRVVRELDKTNQVSEMVAVAQSFNSRRVVLVYPDQVLVAGLVDGSLPRTEPATPEEAGRQGGFYLGAAVGGMTAGLPSHQGFTNLGIAGIDQIFNSNFYFNDQQLTDLSDGGVYVFAQETPDSLPYTIHELTTDPSTLETGEFMVVKNFDFISLFFMDILDDFLGIWNINDDTLDFIRQALNTGISTLRLRKVSRIGAPLLSAEITSLEPHPEIGDRVEINMDIELPRVLNTIGLHLVA